MWLDHKQVGRGYSGHGIGVNNSALQYVPKVGPIPQGVWTVDVAEPSHPHLGPVVMHLEPAKNTKTMGRAGFFIHGDNIKHDKSGSEGCIVLDRSVRELIAGLKRPLQMRVTA